MLLSFKDEKGFKYRKLLIAVAVIVVAVGAYTYFVG